MPIISWSGTGGTVNKFTEDYLQHLTTGIDVKVTNTVDGYGIGTLSITYSGTGTLASTKFPDGKYYVTGIVLVICNQSQDIK